MRSGGEGSTIHKGQRSIADVALYTYDSFDRPQTGVSQFTGSAVQPRSIVHTNYHTVHTPLDHSHASVGCRLGQGD